MSWGFVYKRLWCFCFIHCQKSRTVMKNSGKFVLRTIQTKSSLKIFWSSGQSPFQSIKIYQMFLHMEKGSFRAFACFLFVFFFHCDGTNKSIRPQYVSSVSCELIVLSPECFGRNISLSVYPCGTNETRESQWDFVFLPSASNSQTMWTFHNIIVFAIEAQLSFSVFLTSIFDHSIKFLMENKGGWSCV